VRKLKKSGRLSQVPIVAITGGSVGQASQAFAVGFNHYVLKPIEPETFVSQITAWLPSMNPQLTSPPEAEASPAPAEAFSDEPRATILPVDNRPANLELIRSLLQPLGYRLVTAHGVEEAMLRARQETPASS
jgi:two-component system cell cycle response regulator